MFLVFDLRRLFDWNHFSSMLFMMVWKSHLIPKNDFVPLLKSVQFIPVDVQWFIIDNTLAYYKFFYVLQAAFCSKLALKWDDSRLKSQFSFWHLVFEQMFQFRRIRCGIEKISQIGIEWSVYDEVSTLKTNLAWVKWW